jgi:hypothetical protein
LELFPASETLAKSATMATRRMMNFILIVDTNEMFGWESCKRQRMPDWRVAI